MNYNNITEIHSKLREILNYAIGQSEDKLVLKSIFKNIDVEETCDVPQPIQRIEIINSSISTDLYINGKLCTDWDKM